MVTTENRSIRLPWRLLLSFLWIYKSCWLELLDLRSFRSSRFPGSFRFPRHFRSYRSSRTSRASRSFRCPRSSHNLWKWKTETSLQHSDWTKEYTNTNKTFSGKGRCFCSLCRNICQTCVCFYCWFVFGDVSLELVGHCPLVSVSSAPECFLTAEEKLVHCRRPDVWHWDTDACWVGSSGSCFLCYEAKHLQSWPFYLNVEFLTKKRPAGQKLDETKIWHGVISSHRRLPASGLHIYLLWCFALQKAATTTAAWLFVVSRVSCFKFYLVFN